MDFSRLARAAMEASLAPATEPTLEEMFGRTPTLTEHLVHWRETVGRTTDLAVCDADPLGDGDQRVVPINDATSEGNSLQNFWVDGSLSSILCDPAIPSFLKDAIAPRFVRACSEGALSEVACTLELTRAGGGAAALRDLVLRRHTPLRMSALHWTVAGARFVGKPQFAAFVAASPDHAGVLAALIAHGADVRARDVAGFSPLFHAVTQTCSAASLALVPLLLAAGADIDAPNRFGVPPLASAVMSGLLAPVRLLAEAGADETLPCVSSSPRRLTAMALADASPAAKDIMRGAARRGRRGAGRTLEGARVALHGLTTAALNGRTGVAGRFDPETGRYPVTLAGDVDGGRTVSVRADAVAPLAPDALACVTCGVTPATLCGACMAVSYCGEAHQRAAWRGGHRDACERARRHRVVLRADVRRPSPTGGAGAPGAAAAWRAMAAAWCAAVGAPPPEAAPPALSPVLVRVRRAAVASARSRYLSLSDATRTLSLVVPPEEGAAYVALDAAVGPGAPEAFFHAIFAPDWASLEVLPAPRPPPAPVWA